MKLDLTPPPCDFCGKPTMDMVISVRDGEKKIDKSICGECLWLALEQAHREIRKGRK